MAQNILSIDLSQSPAVAVVFRADPFQLEVLERRFFNYEHEPSNKFDQNGHSQHEPAQASEPFPSPQCDAPAPSLQQAVAALQNEWTNSVVVIPCNDYFSVNLDLPFSDQRSVNQVIDLEVQDLLPFDLEEFLLQHRLLGQRQDDKHEVHVSLIPKPAVRRVLDECGSAQVDPLLVSTPSSVLESLYLLDSRSELSPNAAFVMLRGDSCFVSISINKRIVLDRTIGVDKDLRSQQPERGAALLVGQIGLTLRAAQERIKTALDTVYVLDAGLDVQSIADSCGIRTEFRPLKDCVPGSSAEVALAALSAAFVRDQGSPPALTNFRVKEFRFRPPLKELLRGGSKLAPYLLGTILTLALSLGGLYLVRQRAIADIRSAIRQQVAAALPGIELPASDELLALNREAQTIESELHQLGAVAGFNPLSSFMHLSNYWNASGKIKIKELSFKGREVEFKVEAEQLGDIENLEKTLRRKGNKEKTFCKVETENTSSTFAAAKLYQLKFTLTVCE